MFQWYKNKNVEITRRAEELSEVLKFLGNIKRWRLKYKPVIMCLIIYRNIVQVDQVGISTQQIMMR